MPPPFSSSGGSLRASRWPRWCRPAAGSLPRALRVWPAVAWKPPAAPVDSTGGPGAGNRAPGGALGTGLRRSDRSCSSAARRGLRRAWCSAPRTRGRRAPGVADAVPMFALLPEHCLVSADCLLERSCASTGRSLRSRRWANWRVRGAVWPAAGGDRALAGRAPLPAAACGLCPRACRRSSRSSRPCMPS